MSIDAALLVYGLLLGLITLVTTFACLTLGYVAPAPGRRRARRRRIPAPVKPPEPAPSIADLERWHAAFRAWQADGYPEHGRNYRMLQSDDAVDRVTGVLVSGYQDPDCGCRECVVERAAALRRLPPFARLVLPPATVVGASAVEAWRRDRLRDAADVHRQLPSAARDFDPPVAVEAAAEFWRHHHLTSGPEETHVIQAWDFAEPIAIVRRPAT